MTLGTWMLKQICAQEAWERFMDLAFSFQLKQQDFERRALAQGRLVPVEELEPIEMASELVDILLEE
jgi:hypothetical protein